MSRFSETIDETRPHTLLTPNLKKAGSLDYRYDDTGERVTVPNCWYNQPFQARVEHTRWLAAKADEDARSITNHPPLKMSREAVAEQAARFRAKAERIRREASRMLAAGDPSRPVAASLMKLNFE